MQDRFKFRYYDEQSGKIYDVDSLYCINDSSSRCASLSVNDNEFLHIGQKLFKPENLMQCTGLKDKNGKLIYEGDKVIEYISCDIEPPFIKTVNWVEDAMTGFNLNNKADYEVIGNIYENPELLA